jgi:Chromo (CHRromatin Organisation MOdifier) domain
MIQKAKDNKTPRNPRGKTAEKLKKGDQVWLEGKNLSIKGKQKLMPKRYGPFTITEEVTPVAFRLDLPESMKVHDVFHIDLLSPYKETEAYGTPFARPSLIINKSEEEYEIDAILDVKKQKGRGGGLQYLVHWKEYPNSDNTWVKHKDLDTPELLKEYYQNSATAGRLEV